MHAQPGEPVRHPRELSPVVPRSPVPPQVGLAGGSDLWRLALPPLRGRSGPAEPAEAAAGGGARAGSGHCSETSTRTQAAGAARRAGVL